MLGGPTGGRLGAHPVRALLCPCIGRRVAAGRAITAQRSYPDCWVWSRTGLAARVGGPGRLLHPAPLAGDRDPYIAPQQQPT